MLLHCTVWLSISHVSQRSKIQFKTWGKYQFLQSIVTHAYKEIDMSQRQGQQVVQLRIRSWNALLFFSCDLFLPSISILTSNAYFWTDGHTLISRHLQIMMMNNKPLLLGWQRLHIRPVLCMITGWILWMVTVRNHTVHIVQNYTHSCRLTWTGWMNRLKQIHLHIGTW